MKQPVKYMVLLACLLLGTHSFLNAQANRSQLDSLLGVVKEKKIEGVQLPLLWEVSEQYLRLHKDSARLFSENGLRRSQALSDSLWMAKFSFQLFQYYYQWNDYPESLKYGEQALTIFQHLDLPAETAKCYSEMGTSLTLLEEYSKAKPYFQKGIEISEQNNDTVNLAWAYSSIAFFYYHQLDFQEALNHYDKAQNLFRQLGGKSMGVVFASNATFIGRIHHYMGNMAPALEAHQESYKVFSQLDIPQGVAFALSNIGLIYQEVEYFDKAIDLHLQSLAIRREIGDSLAIAYTLFDIGEFYRKQDQTEKALQTYLEGLNALEAIGDESYIDQFIAAISEIYANQGNIKTARKYFDKSKNPIAEIKLVQAKLFILEKKWTEAIPMALEVYNTTGQEDFIQHKAKSTDYLIESYEALGQHRKALEFSHVKQALTDSLNNIQNSKMTRRLAFEFDSERKEAELANLEKQSQLQQSRLEKQRYLMYVFILLGVVAILAALGFYFLSQKNKQLAAKETQLKNSTLNLFANISHELRTPLSIIRIPLEQLQKGQFKGDLAQTRKTMLDNVKRLADLVDQILDISRTKEKQLKVNLTYDDPIDFLRVFVGQFGSYANHKNLAFGLKVPTHSLSIHYDEEIWSKILNNLINNALKFTEEGSVNVEFEYLKKEVELKVVDTGNGIPPEHLSHIFNRYYRSPLEQHQNLIGGLGLSLVKELVDLYNGTIEVKSEVGQGTTFTIRFPHQEDFKAEEIPTEFEVIHYNLEPDISEVENERVNLIPLSSNPILTSSTNEDNLLKKVLIIEDNIDLNRMIAEYLSPHYQIYQAFDGIEGFEVAQKVVPDLILTDVMMPRMDGVDLAQKLHTSPETSHIPLVVVSALKDEFLDKKLWKSGVVDFVQKPLDMERLLLKINNLIYSREQFKSRIQKSSWLELTSDVPVTDRDKEFLERLQEVLLENMDKEKFNIDDLSQSMLVSRMQLFRKVKSLTGMTPGKFIQKVKMQYAYELLQKQKIENVTEVAASIGYTNLSFFSRKFKEVHGVNAMDVLKNKV